MTNNEDDYLMNTLTVAYCRKSEEDRKRQVLSLDDQINECNKLIKIHELNLVGEHFREEKSGRKAGVRIEFYKMVELLKTGKANVIVCWNANRLARNLRDGSEIIELVQHRGLRIITPYTQYDYSNWFMLMIEFGMATDYSMKLSKDVKRGLDSKVAKGIRPGLAPIGYLNTGEIKGEKGIISDPKRYELIKKWWDLMLTGQYTVEEALGLITDMGLRDKRNNPVSRTAAFKIFHNIFYAGYFKYLGEIHKGVHEAVVSLHEYEKVQRIISGKFGGKYENPTVRRTMPLSGFIHCGECNSIISSDRRTKHYKNGTIQEFSWYRCKKNKGLCTQKAYLSADDLENQVRDYISALELKPQFIDWVRKVLKRRNKEEFDFDSKQKEQFSKRLIQLNEKKERIFAMKIDGLYSEDEYSKRKAELLKEEVQIKEELNSDRISSWERVLDETLNFSGQVMHLFNNGDDYTKRMVLQILGSDLKLQDKKLYLEAKSIFVFLRNRQDELFSEIGSVGPKNEANNDLTASKIPFGAGEGTRTPDVHFGKVTF